jgi:hypothetical protein
LSRTTWLVITIVGLIAFIVGGGAALVDEGSRIPAASNAPAVTISSSPPTLESPSSKVDPVSLVEDEHKGDEHGHGGHGKAKGHDKKGHEGHGKAKGRDEKGHEGHGEAKGHHGDQGGQGEED